MSKQQKAYQLDEAEDGKVYGELDVKQQHPFPKGWMGRVVVRQVDLANVGNNETVEIPSTIRVMNYETEVMDMLERTKGFGATKYTILHDPR